MTYNLLLVLPLFALVPLALQNGSAGQAPPYRPIAQPRDPGVLKPPVGTATISGRVTDAETGMPIRRALVNLNGPMGRAAYTDHEGRYRFTGLPVGTYFVMATPGPNRAAYQPMQFGEVAPTPGLMTRGKPIELGDGATLENVDIALYRTGVITGRVTDGYGEPVSRAQVTAWLLAPGAEPRQTNGASTDDLGQFRLFGLGVGDYLVMATTSMGGTGVEIEGESTGFAPTYAPGTPSQSDAMRVRVGRGTEVPADIRLLETRVYSITGTVVNSQGGSGRGMTVMLMRGEGMGGVSSGGSVRPDGTFAMRNVAPGDYQLVARYSPPRAPGTVIDGPDVNQEIGLAQVQVANSDIGGIVVATAPAAVIAGEIVFDEPPPAGSPATVMPQTTGRSMFFGPPRIDVKGTTFTITNVFGPILLRGSIAGGQGWGLKAVLLKGKDITDVPTAFTASDSGHIQVVFTKHAPSVEGTVVDSDGKPAYGTMVIVFGQDPASWTPRSSWVRTGPVRDGRFTISGLREGRYYAAALPVELTPAAIQPTAEFLESLSKAATPLTLNADEKRAVDLVVLRMQQ